MIDHDLSKEKQILAAAEKVFLDKGYSASKTMEIAEMAGVNHALLHYYFRTKEKLFHKVFTEKMELFINSFRELFDQELPFFELIRFIIEKQYDFFAENEKLPHFIIHEIMANEQHRLLFRDHFFPKFQKNIAVIESLLQEEIRKETIREIGFIDLIISISSLNMFFFLIKPVVELFREENRNFQIESLFEERKKVHVDQILQWLKR